MTKTEYEKRLLAATPELGYKLLELPASRALPDVEAAREALLMLGRGPQAAFFVDSALERITQESWPVALLREQIEKLGVRAQGRARADLGRQLVSLLLDPGRLELVFRGLDTETQVFYAQLLLNFDLGVWNPRFSGMLLIKPISQPMEVLTSRIVDAGLALEQEPGLLMIPTHLQRHLPRLYLPADVFALPRAPQREQTARPAYTVVQIQQFLGLLTSRKIALRPTRQWLSPEPWQRAFSTGLLPTPEAARSLTKLRPNESLLVELLPPEPALAQDDLKMLSQTLSLPEVTVEALYHLLMALQVLRPGSPVQVEPALLETFLTLDPGEQLTALTRAFPAIGIWSPIWELWREGLVRLQWNYRPYYGLVSYPQIALQTFTNLGRLCLQYLALLPHDLWLAPMTVADLLLRFISKPEHVSPYNALQLTDARGSWEGFMALYLEALLTGPLHWLGLCDVGRDRDGAFSAFRLRHLQDVVWLREKAFPLPPTVWTGERRGQWDWKREMLLLRPPVPAPVMQLLHQWAEPAGIENDRLCYRPDVQRLYNAFESGETAETLRQRWLQSAGAEPPPELRAWWETWQQRYGHVRLYSNQAVLVAADEFTLKEVQAALPELREGVLGLINSRTALLRAERVDRLLQQLMARGYMPKDLGASDAGKTLLPAAGEDN